MNVDFISRSSTETQTASLLRNPISFSGGDDCRNFEPKLGLKFEVIDKSIQELRAIYKVHPEWFETPKPKSVKGKNEVEYSLPDLR